MRSALTLVALLMCIFVDRSWLQNASYSGDVQEQVLLSGERYSTSVIKAQCLAFCLHKHGLHLDTPSDRSRYDVYNNVYLPPPCLNTECKKCTELCKHDGDWRPKCDLTYVKEDTVRFLCEKILSTKGQKDIPISAIRQDASQPTVSCKDVPKINHRNTFTATVYVRWNAKRVLNTSIAFVFDMRSRDKNGTMTDWFPSIARTNAFLPIRHLHPETEYQVRVLPVNQHGISGRFAYSDWFATLGVGWRLSAPSGGRVLYEFVRHHKVSIVVEWTASEEQHCLYKMSLLGETGVSSNDLEINKARPQFRYLIENLDFSADYTLKMSSFVRISGREQIGQSSDVIFRTKSCLNLTNHNFTICPPGTVNNISTSLLSNTSQNNTFVKVLLKWAPPRWADDDNMVLWYHVTWTRRVPLHRLEKTRPHKGQADLNGTYLECQIDGLHVNTFYEVQVSATTLGGTGRPRMLLLNTTRENNLQVIDFLRGGEKRSTLFIVVGIIVAVVVTTLILIRPIIKHRKRTMQLKKKFVHEVDNNAGIIPLMAKNPLYLQTQLEESKPIDVYDEYQVDFDSLILYEFIGQGAFGKVVRAQLTSVPQAMKNIASTETFVAVKMLKGTALPDEKKNFDIEIEMMKQLGRHPHIVSIVACCTAPPNVCLVMDYCPLGDLRNYLKKMRERRFIMYGIMTEELVIREIRIDEAAGRGDSDSGMTSFELSGDALSHEDTARRSSGSANYSSDSGVISNRKCDPSNFSGSGDSHVLSKENGDCPGLSYPVFEDPDRVVADKCETSDRDGDHLYNISKTLPMKLLSYARQIAIGMEYISQNKFVHRDLAARNVLLAGNDVVKISDFGLTRDIYEESLYRKHTTGKLPIKWMSIEAIFDQVYTIKSDVWSFGVVLWEIVTLGGTPYPGVPNHDLYGLLKDGYRMERPDNCGSKIYEIMLACWHPGPVDRPSFSHLRKKLDAILEDSLCTQHAYRYMDLDMRANQNYYHNEQTDTDSNDDPLVKDNELKEGEEEEKDHTLQVEVHRELSKSSELSFMTS